MIKKIIGIIIVLVTVNGFGDSSVMSSVMFTFSEQLKIWRLTIV